MNENESGNEEDLSSQELAVLRFLQENEQKGMIPEQEIVLTDYGTQIVRSAVSWLIKKGFVDEESTEETIYELGEEGKKSLKEGLPEALVYNYTLQKGQVSIEELNSVIPPEIVKIGITQLAKLGVRPSGGNFKIENGEDIETELQRRLQCLNSVAEGKYPGKDCLETFRKRGNMIVERRYQKRKLRINPEGRQILLRSSEGAIGQLTPEMISSGAWKSARFRKYDLNMAGENVSGSFLHPLSYLREEVSRIFLDMGFSEMRGHFIEYSGWNMDALFIPQDHPAREMQDTFYIETDREPEFEDPEILPILKKVHERGIRGYTGWGYKWSESEAKKLLLRTHTTVSTIRNLYHIGKAPAAVFSIDRVFRHESVDWKHLAELHQIEGAYYAEDANLSTLKWLMEEFYSRLGFSKIRLVPSYYPYTEPSMDVVVEIDGKEVELGGSGIFRPEVLKPLGLDEPAIAWGMGLERLAMIYYDLNDIRGIYQSDINWLKSFRLRI